MIYNFKHLKSQVKRVYSSFSTVVFNSYTFFVDFGGQIYFDDCSLSNPRNIIKDRKFIEKLYRCLDKNNDNNKKYEFYA